MIELTPRHLEMPHALAGRYARPHSNRYDELVSAGNLALVEAAARYDPGHAAGALAETYLYASVRWAVRAAAYPCARSRHGQAARWAAAVSLDEPAAAGGPTAAEALPDRAAAHERAAEASDLAARLLAPLSDQQRLALWLTAALGMSYREAGARAGAGHPEQVRSRCASGLALARAEAARLEQEWP